MFSVRRVWFRIEGSRFDMQGNWGLGLRAQDISRLQGLDFRFPSVHIRCGVEGSSSGESKSRRSYNYFCEQNFPLESARVLPFRQIKLLAGAAGGFRFRILLPSDLGS